MTTTPRSKCGDLLNSDHRVAVIWLIERGAIGVPARTDLRFRDYEGDPLATQLSTDPVVADGTRCLESA